MHLAPVLVLLSSVAVAQSPSYITFLYSDARTTTLVSYIYTPPAGQGGQTPSSVQSLQASTTDVESTLTSVTPAASATASDAPQSSISSILSTIAGVSTRSSNAVTSIASQPPAAATTGSSSTGGAAGALATNDADLVNNRRSGGLSTGAIIGLSVGLGVFGLLLFLAIFFFCFVRRKRKNREATAAAAPFTGNEKEDQGSGSDVNMVPSEYPAPVAVPSNYDRAREPTLPTLNFEDESANSPSFSPVAAPGHGHQPITDAIPVSSAAEAGAAVEAYAAQNKPWAPTGYKPYRASGTDQKLSGFDFGLGNQGGSSSGAKAQNRYSIPRRPVGNS